jgi:hypothetical protein
LVVGIALGLRALKTSPGAALIGVYACGKVIRMEIDRQPVVAQARRQSGCLPDDRPSGGLALIMPGLGSEVVVAVRVVIEPLVPTPVACRP